MSPSLFSAMSKTLPVSVTSTASTAAVLPNAGNTIRIVNEGPNTAFVCLATTAALAVATLPNATPTNTSTPVLAGSDVVFGIPNSQAFYISAICRAAGTATLDVSVGEGA